MKKTFTTPSRIFPLNTPLVSIRIGAYERAHPSDILYCQGDRNYTHVHLADGRCLVVSLTLGVLEARLAAGGFLRVNRGQLVNKQHIEQYDGLTITLTNGTDMEVARRRRRGVRVSLGLFSEKFFAENEKCA